MRPVSWFTLVPVSRRKFLGISGAAMSLKLDASGDATAAANGSFRLVRVFKNCACRAVSPDSRWLCLASTKTTTTGKFMISVSGKGRSVSHRGPDPTFDLKVIETGSWKEIYSEPVPGIQGGFSFFQDGNSLYGACSAVTPPLTNRYVLIDLPSGARKEIERAQDPDTASYYHALRDNILIGIGTRRGLFKSVWRTWSRCSRFRWRTAPIFSG